MAILNYEQFGERINAVIDTLRSYASIPDRTARHMAADALGSLLEDVAETDAADRATRPKQQSRRPNPPTNPEKAGEGDGQ